MEMRILKNNRTFSEGGGLTSILLPKQFTKLGLGLFAVGSGAVSFGKEALASHNKLAMGDIIYTGGPARMTNNFSSGAIEAIKDVTSDPALQADMLKKVTKTTEFLGGIEEYGVDGEFISSFFGM